MLVATLQWIFKGWTPVVIIKKFDALNDKMEEKIALEKEAEDAAREAAENAAQEA